MKTLGSFARRASGRSPRSIGILEVLRSHPATPFAYWQKARRIAKNRRRRMVARMKGTSFLSKRGLNAIVCTLKVRVRPHRIAGRLRFTANGYIGLQRYGWLWSGDTASTWRTLHAQIMVGIAAGLSESPIG